jgi:hypothetical protein
MHIAYARKHREFVLAYVLARQESSKQAPFGAFFVRSHQSTINSAGVFSSYFNFAT